MLLALQLYRDLTENCFREGAGSDSQRWILWCLEILDTIGGEITLRSQQDLNLGHLNAGQMLLPTEPLELWRWS